VSAVVAGVGQTRFTRPGRVAVTEHALAAEAIVRALRDARIPPAEVDGVVRFDRDALWEYDLPGALRMPTLSFYDALPFGAGSAPALLRMAAMAVRERLATTVVCYHARNGGGRPAATAPAEAALVARRFGIGERDVAGVTIAHRRAAARNAKALVRKPLTPAARLRSPYVAEPLRRVDVADAAVGGCALVVTTVERCRRAPVRILGSMQAAVPSTAHHLSEWFGRKPLDEIRRAARAMFAEARVSAADVDVACLHADASALVPLAQKTYGVESARVDPHGGQLCEAALDGVNDVVEAVRQLRGDAASPVRGARVALVAGSLLEPTSALLLGRP
jgi:acetyl-CoA acetyltransferase